VADFGVNRSQYEERKMKSIIPSLVSAALVILGSGAASAGEPIKDTGAMACVTDRWDVQEPEKGHKLVDAAMRCVLVPDLATGFHLGTSKRFESLTSWTHHRFTSVK
jgi:hypothetical protein